MTNQQLADELLAVYQAARRAGLDPLPANERVHDRAKERDRDLEIIRQCIGRKS